VRLLEKQPPRLHLALTLTLACSHQHQGTFPGHILHLALRRMCSSAPMLYFTDECFPTASQTHESLQNTLIPTCLILYALRWQCTWSPLPEIAGSTALGPNADLIYPSKPFPGFLPCTSSLLLVDVQ
jgi:hypothetical protein